MYFRVEPGSVLFSGFCFMIAEQGWRLLSAAGCGVG